MSIGVLGKCGCCGCNDGATIDAWLNQTQALLPGTSTTCQSTLSPRYDSTNSNKCPSATAGYCGRWLSVGDLNGVPAQEIDSIVDDICPCTTPDSTHYTIDHNCLVKSGTVNMKHRRLGAQFIHAIKWWHGCKGIIDRGDPNLDSSASFTTGLVTTGGTGFIGVSTTFSTSAPQTRYRTSGMSVVSEHFPADYTTPPAADQSSDYEATDTIGRYTGIHAKTGSSTGAWSAGSDPAVTTDAYYTGSPAWRTLGQSSWNEIYAYFAQTLFLTYAAGSMTAAYYAADTSDPSKTVYSLMSGSYTDGGGTAPDFELERVEIPTGTAGGTFYRKVAQNYWNGSTRVAFTVVEETVVVDNTSITCTVDWWNPADLPYGYLYIENKHLESSYTLSDAYTAANVLADFYALLAEWDMSNFNLAKLREDEKLALAPLCMYDEVQSPVEPALDFVCTMPDYTGTAPYADRTWLDPNDYIWQDPSGHYYTDAGEAVDSSTLVTPMRDGTKIAYTKVGADKYFWFGALKKSREETSPGSGIYQWYYDYWGQWSNAAGGGYLPPVARRWMDEQFSQYDAATDSGWGGNYPQSFLKQKAACLVGGKYVEAPLPWPSFNGGKPCGWQRYEIDQTTVCCIEDGTTYNVTPTPGNTFTLAVDDYIGIETSGGDLEIYPITGFSGTGPYTLTVGSLIETVPGATCRDPSLAIDDGGVLHLGKLRWVNYTQYATTFVQPSPFCGRVACTVNTGAGTIALTSYDYVYRDVNGDILLDVYLDGMTGKVQLNLAATGTAGTFTYTVQSGSLTGSEVWAVGRDVDYTKNATTAARTYVTLEYTFNLRATDASYPSPPTFYGGISGSLACDINQWDYDLTGSCLPMIGFVPYTAGSPTTENFGDNSNLFAMPDTFAFDDIYGALWLGIIETTMPDPFWQAPFNPDCAGDGITWNEDNGCGAEDDVTNFYYPHHPLVEAVASVPAGKSLPTGLHAYFDDTTDQISPPYFPDGIPIETDGSGDYIGYLSVERPYGFALRVCEQICTTGGINRFAAYYGAFTTCPAA